MGTHIALISSAFLLSSFPLAVIAVIKFFAVVWVGAVVSLLAVFAAAFIARWLILPYADPQLYRLITEPPER